MSPKQKKIKKNQLLLEYGSCCYWCRKEFPMEKLTIDHLKPKSKGGSNNLENLRLACFECNNSRGNSLFPPDKIIFSFLGGLI
jgi:5-methylcytosine-specific restriction endonuclease McrA